MLPSVAMRMTPSFSIETKLSFIEKFLWFRSAARRRLHFAGWPGLSRHPLRNARDDVRDEVRVVRGGRPPARGRYTHSRLPVPVKVSQGAAAFRRSSGVAAGGPSSSRRAPVPPPAFPESPAPPSSYGEA